MFGNKLGAPEALLLFVFLFMPVALVITIFYILTLRARYLVAPCGNRTTSPDLAWLLLIPIFNLIWPFILYPHISESLNSFLSNCGTDSAVQFLDSVLRLTC
jgi:hypothetical protein